MTLYLANGSKYNGKPPLGRRAPPVVSSKTTAVRVRSPDGRLFDIQWDLLEVALNGKSATCGCDCNAEPKMRCEFQKQQLATANKHSCDPYHRGGYHGEARGLVPQLQ